MKKEHWNERHPRPQGTPELPPTDLQFRRRLDDLHSLRAADHPGAGLPRHRGSRRHRRRGVHQLDGPRRRDLLPPPTGFGEIYGSNVTEWPQAEGLELPCTRMAELHPTCSTTTAPGCRRPAAMPTPRTRSSCCARLTTRGGSPAGTSATPSAWTCSSIPPSRGARCPSPSRSGTRARARCSGSSSGTTSNPRGGNRPWPIPGCGSPAGSTTPPWWRHRSPLNGSRLDSGRRIELPSTTTVTWRDVPVVQGENRIWVALDRIEGQDCLRIVGIELVIAYV